MKIGVVIVCYDNNVDYKSLINDLSAQLLHTDKLVVVDNNPNHINADKLQETKRIDHLVRNTNVGFGAACNQGADLINKDVDALLFLNPDTHLSEDTIQKYRQVDHKYSAYMSNLLIDKEKINNSGTVVHISGLSWSGGFKNKFKLDKENKYTPTNYISGACLFIWAKDFYEVGKFYDDYFLYYEDTDLITRLLLSGKKSALINDAIVYHDYVDSISDVKYFYIQRNRYFYILINWPLSILMLLSPIIILIELMLLAHSIIERKFILKIKTYFDLLIHLRTIFVLRNRTMNLKKISDREYFRTLSPKLDTKLIPDFPGRKLLNTIFSLYYLIVDKILSI